MNKLNKALLINCLLFLSIIQNFAMESEKDEIIEGELFIVPNNGIYAAQKWPEKSDNQLNLQANDMLVQVCATNDECKNWRDHVYSRLGENQRFPGYLPYRLFNNKKEGDIITLQYMEGKSIVLHLRQLKSRYAYATFENILKDVKDRFVKNAFHIDDVDESLLKQGIVVTNNSSIYCYHGPNGFKDE
jgi:hypothetical protein